MGGKISLITTTFRDEHGKPQLEVRLQDDGPGIPEDYKNKIFEMFFQVEQTPRFEMESSGVGLALVKEMVQLHKGTIVERGTAGEGALFVIRMPADQEIFNLESTEVLSSESEPSQFAAENTTTIANDQEYNSEITILIVEDNDELRAYLVAQLSLYYEIEQASNGQEGYEKAKALIPNFNRERRHDEGRRWAGIM